MWQECTQEEVAIGNSFHATRYSRLFFCFQANQNSVIVFNRFLNEATKEKIRQEKTHLYISVTDDSYYFIAVSNHSITFKYSSLYSNFFQVCGRCRIEHSLFGGFFPIFLDVLKDSKSSNMHFHIVLVQFFPGALTYWGDQSPMISYRTGSVQPMRQQVLHSLQLLRFSTNGPIHKLIQSFLSAHPEKDIWKIRAVSALYSVFYVDVHDPKSVGQDPQRDACCFERAPYLQPTTQAKRSSFTSAL